MNLKQYRKDLHQIPELGFEEFKTSKYIHEQIKNYDCEVTDIKTGLVLYFNRGQSKTIAFRSDMDALPVKEETYLEFKSTNNNMHACGHDGHMAMLLGLASYVNSHKDLKYNVVLIFQPSEELLGGALSIIETGILEKYHVEAIFGTHIWPNMQKGIIYTRANELMARSCEVDVEVYGKSAHIANSEKGADALECAMEFIRNMYSYIKYDDPATFKLLKFGKMESGTIRNVISDYSHLYGSLRGYDDEFFKRVDEQLSINKFDLEADYGTLINVQVKDSGYPPVINNKELVSKITNQVPSIKLLDKPVLQAEDFGNYCSKYPCVFFFLGDEGTNSLHNSKFDFDMDILEKGLENYINILNCEL